MRAMDGPSDRDAAGVGSDGPFPSQFGPVCRVLPGSFPSTGCFVREPSSATSERSRPMMWSRHARHGRGAVEHARRDPFVTAGSQCRVRDLVLEDRLDADPRAARDQADEDPPKAQPIRDPGPVTAQRMVLRMGGIRGSTAAQTASTTSGRVRAYVGDLHLVVGWNAPRIKSGPSQRPVDGHLSGGP